jgi:peptidoglycan hydrolase-like protein with peptidoglycan-binding domain
MRNSFWGKIRPALLLMLLSAAGLGVPGAFSQTAARGPAKKKTSHGSAPTSSKNSGVKASSSKSSANTSATNKSAATASSHPASSRSAAGHATSKKTSASKRSRRQPGQKAPTSDRVSEIQSALAKNGSFAGEPNGKWDDSTSDAMRKFQASHGLNPTGKLDALTLQKLGLGSQTAGVAAPTPPPGSVSRLTSSNSLAASTESARRQ